MASSCSCKYCSPTLLPRRGCGYKPDPDPDPDRGGAAWPASRARGQHTARTARREHSLQAACLSQTGQHGKAWAPAPHPPSDQAQRLSTGLCLQSHDPPFCPGQPPHPHFSAANSFSDLDLSCRPIGPVTWTPYGQLRLTAPETAPSPLPTPSPHPPMTPHAL